MKFEVINQFGTTVMWCNEYSCIPNPAELKSMSDAGYRFKVDNKIIICSKLIDMLEAAEPKKPTTGTATKKMHRWF